MFRAGCDPLLGKAVHHLILVHWFCYYFVVKVYNSAKWAILVSLNMC